ncbi:ROK family protein [Suttonella sp. R2A3]|uniref:ROK family protein n=1 Tax=Suttonella sp. R2A3 TaxID=2908648 RepID=UPI001F1F0A3D|nr:ROK family protein [Suttonella sp. R2A3]UJF24498.1 ROK family protein [Suttonella sp. R2A3]
MQVLSIDIGGTTVKSALYREDGSEIAVFPSEETAIVGGKQQISEQVIALCQRVAQTHRLDGVAISSAGVIDPFRGEVVFAGPSIPGYSGTALKIEVERACALPCAVENDVNAMALGEAWLGAAQGCDSALCLTLGTGLGGAILLNGELWRGHQFSAGEIGHIPLAGGRRLEEDASTRAMLRDYQVRSGELIDGQAFFKRIEAGEAQAEAALTHMLDALTTGLLAAVHLLSPQAIIIGGAVAAQSHILEPRIQSLLAARVSSALFMPEIVRCAALGNRAGQIGALRWFLQSQADTHD